MHPRCNVAAREEWTIEWGYDRYQAARQDFGKVQDHFSIIDLVLWCEMFTSVAKTTLRLFAHRLQALQFHACSPSKCNHDTSSLCTLYRLPFSLSQAWAKGSNLRRVRLIGASFSFATILWGESFSSTSNRGKS
jgi:hypothetical protein